MRHKGVENGILAGALVTYIYFNSLTFFFVFSFTVIVCIRFSKNSVSLLSSIMWYTGKGWGRRGGCGLVSPTGLINAFILLTAEKAKWRNPDKVAITRLQKLLDNGEYNSVSR